MRKPGCRYTINEKTKKQDKNSKSVHCASMTTIKGSDYKQGGPASIVEGNWAGHIVTMGSEKLGRWNYIKLAGKERKVLKIISPYRVCNQKHQQGICTIYMQQETDLVNDGRKETDPRKALLEDLSTQIQKDHKEGKMVILLGDMNEDIGGNRNIKDFLDKINMYNVMQVKHKGDLPKTHGRGRDCLDMVAASNSIQKKRINRAVYQPFYHGIYSDHRGMFVDLDIKEIFNHVKGDTNKEIYRRFTTTQTPKWEKYVKKLEYYLEEANIGNKIDDLEADILRWEKDGEGDVQEIIRRCKILFEKTTQLMIASERKVGRKHYLTGYPSSRTLTEAADEYFEVKTNLRKCYYTYDNTELRNKLKVAGSKVKEKKKDLKKKQKEAKKLREDDLVKLAENRQKDGT